MKILSKLIPLLLCLSPVELFAQTNRFGAGTALFHTQRFGSRWGASLDAQSRFASSSFEFQNILLRPFINYYLKGNKITSLGYVYLNMSDHNVAGTHSSRAENRVWEQFIINKNITRTSTSQYRFRLEQRFIGNTPGQNDHYFAQRLRNFARAVLPFRTDTSFTKGPFLGLQNEIYLNVFNKDKVNGHFFDQNRAYISIGYRLSKKVDLEMGYVNQYIKQANGSLITHVIQTAVYTRF